MNKLEKRFELENKLIYFDVYYKHWNRILIF